MDWWKKTNAMMKTLYSKKIVSIWTLKPMPLFTSTTSSPPSSSTTSTLFASA
ncbi:hypothetical protein REPUB_Repub02eG0203700 [Reevesia pubescens]